MLSTASALLRPAPPVRATTALASRTIVTRNPDMRVTNMAGIVEYERPPLSYRLETIL
jgi:hypothetical protein